MSTTAEPAALAAARQAWHSGDAAGVLSVLEPLIAGTVTSDEVLALAANAALRLNAPERAIDPLERLHRRYPQQDALRRSLSMACNNHGARLHRANDIPGAERALSQALLVWPDNVEALYNHLQILLERFDAGALPLLERLHVLRPHDEAVTIDLALQRLRRGIDETARAADLLLSTRDAAAAPRIAIAAEQVQDLGDTAAARRLFAHAAALADDGVRAPGLRARVASALLLPAAYENAAELRDARGTYLQGLESLHALADGGALDRAEPLLEQLQWSNFLLANPGEDDRPAQQRYGEFLHRAIGRFDPALLQAPAVPQRARPRIGVLSSGLRYCTVGSYFGPWLRALTDAGFETHAFALGPGFDATTDALARDVTRLERLDAPLAQIAATVREAALDLLIFPDIGMDARVQVLAACRLAARQYAAWGHPVTTGLSTVDGYLSCASMEPPGAAAHYSEPLHLLPGIGTAYATPERPPAFSREQLGLPSGRLYLVPQSAFKIHPDMDATLAAIAQRDREATLVLFSSPASSADTRLRARLERALTAAGAMPHRQLLMLPHVDRTRFLLMCAACDVMVDTPHWSGGNASIDALIAGVPVVTVPGRFMRGRQSAAMLTQLGVADALVCADASMQVERALAVAHDPALRARLSNRIDNALPALFDGSEAFVALVDTIRAALDRAP